MKVPLSLRIEEDLLKSIQAKAEAEGDSVNGFVEKLFGYYLIANKYLVKSKVKEYYENEHLGGGDVISSPEVYVITNGLDFLVIDDYYKVPIEKGDYVFQCSVINGQTSIKQITTL